MRVVTVPVTSRTSACWGGDDAEPCANIFVGGCSERQFVPHPLHEPARRGAGRGCAALGQAEQVAAERWNCGGVALSVCAGVADPKRSEIGQQVARRCVGDDWPVGAGPVRGAGARFARRPVRPRRVWRRGTSTKLRRSPGPRRGSAADLPPAGRALLSTGRSSSTALFESRLSSPATRRGATGVNRCRRGWWRARASGHRGAPPARRR